MGKNTPLLREIINVLTDHVFDAPLALRTLEEHFQDRLIVNAGDIQTVKAEAKQLRLRVEQEEYPPVLDYIAHLDCRPHDRPTGPRAGGCRGHSCGGEYR